jgi:hypothetical protein
MTRHWLTPWRRDAAPPVVPPPPQPPTDCGATTCGPVSGRYAGSTTAAQWLDCVTEHGLAVCGAATLVVRTDGVLIERAHQPDVYLPRTALRGARLDAAIGGSVYEADGVVVLTWQSGQRLIDTGFRAVPPDDHAAIVAAVQTLTASTMGGAA